MTLAVRRTISRGATRATTLTGLLLMVAFAALELVLIGVSEGSSYAVLTIESSQGTGLSLPVSSETASAIGTAGTVAGVVLLVAITRAMVRDEAELTGFPVDIVTRRLVRASLSTFISAIPIVIAVWLGAAIAMAPFVVGAILLFVAATELGTTAAGVVLILLAVLTASGAMIVGIGAVVYLLVGFAFVLPMIAVEDRGVFDAMSRSWALSSEHRGELFALLLAVFGLHLLTGVVGLALSVAFGGQPVADLVSASFSAVLLVLSLAVVGDAYLQLREMTPHTADTDSNGDLPETGR